MVNAKLHGSYAGRASNDGKSTLEKRRNIFLFGAT